MKKPDILKEARERFDLARDAENHNRVEMLEDLKFANGEQWPESVRKAREEDGRPCLTINKLPQALKQVLNDQRQNRPAIKIRPVDDVADPETAEVLSGLVRNIEDQSMAEIAYDTAFEYAALAGLGYFRVTTEYSNDDGFEQDIRIKRITNPFTVYMDPASREPDGSDAKYCFVTEMVPRKEFKERYPGCSGWDDNAGQGEDLEAWYEPDAIRVAEYWRRVTQVREVALLSTGETIDYHKKMDPALIVRTRKVSAIKVEQYLLTGREIISRQEWAGKYIPIIPVVGDEMYISGKRYLRGMVRFAKDPQRMYNYWRSAETEMIALQPKAPYIGPSGAFVGHEHKWAHANTKSFAYLEFEGNVAPQRQPMAGMSAGMAQAALSASDDIKSTTAIYDASLGAKSNETSGKAILARQKEGDVATFNYVDNLARAIRHCGRILVDLIPRIYDTERVIRVLGRDGEQKSVRVNQEYVDPESGRVLVHDLSQGKYDVTVDVGPSYSTQRQESAESMMELIRSFPDAAPVIGDLVAKHLDWPGADEIAERLKMLLPAQIQDPENQMQQKTAALDQQLQQMAQKAQQQLMQKQMDAELDLERKKMHAEVELERKTMMAEIEIERRRSCMTHEEPAQTAGFFSPE